jgi:leader peptidase (prepilin peptidase)/N-methyltransferase
VSGAVVVRALMSTAGVGSLVSGVLRMWPRQRVPGDQAVQPDASDARGASASTSATQAWVDALRRKPSRWARRVMTAAVVRVLMSGRQVRPPVPRAVMRLPVRGVLVAAVVVVWGAVVVLVAAGTSLAVVAAGLCAGAGGAAAGYAVRLLLRRLRRGALIRPPWCETAVGLLWAGPVAAWAAGALPAGWVPALLGLGWFGVAAGAVDLAHRRLPDALTLPALPVALLLLLPLGATAVLHGLAGAAVAAVAHAAVHLVAPRAMGAGDVKLAAPLGVVLAAAGWPAPVLSALLAAVLTAVLGVTGLATRRLGRGAALPHGPSMLVATWLVTSWLAAVGAVPAPEAGG